MWIDKNGANEFTNKATGEINLRCGDKSYDCILLILYDFIIAESLAQVHVFHLIVVFLRQQEIYELHQSIARKAKLLTVDQCDPIHSTVSRSRLQGTPGSLAF